MTISLRRLTWQSGQSARAAGELDDDETKGTASRDQRCYTWGSNVSGQLGHGERLTAIKPTLVGHRLLCSPANPVVRIAVGSRFTCALLRSGALYTWGRGDDGQLGHGDANGQLAPRLVEALAKVTLAEIAVRGSHVLALSEGGSVYAWGRGDDGQLGHGAERKEANTPIPVEALKHVPVSQIACGRTMSVAVSREERAVYSWGCGDDGSTGHGDGAPCPLPKRVSKLTGMSLTSVSCGSRHALVGTDNGDVYAWGWGIYGQLGLGDTAMRTEPEQVSAFVGKHVERVECGYRHSFAIVRGAAGEDEIYGWGWNQHGQLGFVESRKHSRLGLDSMAMATNCVLIPQRLDLAAGARCPQRVLDIAGGGRHSLLVTADAAPAGHELLMSPKACTGATLIGPRRFWAWGRGDDGQLGLADVKSWGVPCVVRTLGQGDIVLAVGAGWAHSCAIIAEGNGDDCPSSPGPRAKMPIYGLSPGRGDLDGVAAQLLGCVTTYMLALKVLPNVCGMTENEVLTHIVPAMGLAYMLGNILFGMQGLLLARSERRHDVTAQIHGVAIVLFYAFAVGVMGPAYQQAFIPCLKNGGSAHICKAAASREAWQAGVFANFMTAALQVCAAPAADSMRRLVPREALMSVVAGVSLTYISMNFIFEVYASPSYALLPALFMIICGGSQIRLPYNLPVGFISLFVGTLLAWGSVYINVDDFTLDSLRAYAQEADSSGDTTAFSLNLPAFHFDVWCGGFTVGWRHMTVILPMFLLNFGNNLANIESASAVGDNFSVRDSMLTDSAVSIVCALCGSPFPTQIFIGQPAFKAMGARSSYAFFAAGAMGCLGFTGCMTLVLRVVPIAAGVGFLMWIGVLVTKTAFDSDPAQLVDHGSAVVVGLIPPLASWALSLVTATYTAYGKLLGVRQVPEAPVLFGDLCDALSGGGVFVYGMISLSQGYLLISIFLSSTLAFASDQNFLKAALWMLIGSVSSAFGIVHSFHVAEDNAVEPMIGGMFRPDGGSWGARACAAVYLAAALLCAVLHVRVQERGFFGYGLEKMKLMSRGMQHKTEERRQPLLHPGSMSP